jgi:nucleotide-binding universal stress UspA family protein
MPYRHILISTDGSARSRRAIAAAVELAQKFDAQLTSLYVVLEGVPTAFSGRKLYASSVMSPKYRAAIRKAETRALLVAERAAQAAGVRHSSAGAKASAPWEAIVRVARAKKCDLIVMAAHGKRGLAALRSQTVKTVAHTRIPVLVCR